MNPARVIFPAIRWDGRDAEAVWPGVREAVDQGVGGFIVFDTDLAPMRDLVDRTEGHAGRPLLFAADLERGAGQQIATATALPPPLALARQGPEAVAEAARITACQARAAGIDWILAPVADLDVEPANPIVGTRSFGSDPGAVAELVAAWVTAAQTEGAIACAKHFPGHGRTTADSHAELPVVEAARSELETDLLPFRVAVAAGVGSVMMAHVAYPELDPRGAPASLSEHIVRSLRDELGFEGLVVTDALIMDALASGGWGQGSASVAALRAGCDALLYPSDVEDSLKAIEAALADGSLPESRLRESVTRVERATRAVRGGGDLGLRPALEDDDRARAFELALGSIAVLRGGLPALRGGAAARLWIVDDDGPDGVDDGPTQRSERGEELRARLKALGVRVLSESDRDEALDLAVVFSEVRAWKGRAGLSEASRQALGRIAATAPNPAALLFGHPRLAAELAGFSDVVCGWWGDRLMQEAMAQRLAGRETT